MRRETRTEIKKNNELLTEFSLSLKKESKDLCEYKLKSLDQLYDSLSEEEEEKEEETKNFKQSEDDEEESEIESEEEKEKGNENLRIKNIFGCLNLPNCSSELLLPFQSQGKEIHLSIFSFSLFLLYFVDS